MAVQLGFLDGDANTARRKAFKEHEARVARLLGGRGTIGSGNKGMKGDVWAGDADAGQRLMVECKVTGKEKVVLQRKWLEKVVKEAREAGAEPVLALRLPIGGHTFDFACIPLDRWYTLIEDAPARAADVVTGGHQVTLDGAWFTLHILYDRPGVVAFATPPGAFYTMPERWAILTLSALRDLYAAEAVRRTAA
jgi:hypothetical protein